MMEVARKANLRNLKRLRLKLPSWMLRRNLKRPALTSRVLVEESLPAPAGKRMSLTEVRGQFLIRLNRTSEGSETMKARMEEYLSGLSEQYSQYNALQQMLGQAAITQQLQTAMQSQTSSPTTGGSSLATQAALAQYMQQVQQVQLATAVSAASSGSSSPSKPLSSMLSSMAMLQNMSSVGNYAQAQAMMSMMMTGSGHSSAPKRGRGSRGAGGSGSSPRGRKTGITKLKRLERGELTQIFRLISDSCFIQRRARTQGWRARQQRRCGISGPEEC